MGQIDKIIKEASEISDAMSQQKQRSMIYQVDLKEKTAIKNGLPPSTYYDLPYNIWANIRDKIEQAEEDRNGTGKKK